MLEVGGEPGSAGKLSDLCVCTSVLGEGKK